MTDFTTVVGLLAIAGLAWARLGISHPATLFATGWLLVVGANAAVPMGLVAMNQTVALTILLGVGAFCVPALLWVPRPATRRTPHSTALEHPPLSYRRFVIVTSLVTGLYLVGLWQFRLRIAMAAGRDFGQLDSITIRHFQSSDEGRGGGLALLLFSLGPVVACLGVLGFKRFSRSWLALVAVALLVSTQSPGRTTTIATVVAALAFSLYERRIDERPPLSRRIRAAGLLLGVFTTIAIYFVSVGNSLDKSSQFAGYVPSAAVPDALLTPTLYQTGGISAFSVALDLGGDPTAGSQGRSVYLGYRLADYLGLDVNVPDTIADYSRIPMPFNVYTAFGDVWFDYGERGVVLIFVLFGAAAHRIHRRAIRGLIGARWIAALLLSVLASTPISLRLLYLDTVFQLCVGLLAFTVLGRSCRASSERRMDARAPRPSSAAWSPALGR